jgi:hypothetical protein
VKNRLRSVFAAAMFAAGMLATGFAQTPNAQDGILRLSAKLASGESKLDTASGHNGYLASLLKNLDIHQDSQVLVFSKTSFQAAKISTHAPRAIYFNDNMAVGSVQEGDVFEVITLSPREGVIFYTLDTTPASAPKFERRDALCYTCHGLHNGGVPGYVVNSVFPGPDGMPFAAGQFFQEIDHRTPLEERWGGWYVTGTHGSQEHRGNAVAPDPTHPMDLETKGTLNLTSLTGRFDNSKYLGGSSDIVALMTLEHQSGASNLIARLNLVTQAALRDGTFYSTGGKRVDTIAQALADYLLFVDEAQLKEPIRGTSTFAQTFAERGPRDSKGRSLREFDLKTRMFRYPLSYMIYNEAFDAIPNSAREKVYRRLYDILSGKETGPKFARLSPADRRAILEILRETKPNLPEYWRGPINGGG